MKYWGWMGGMGGGGRGGLESFQKIIVRGDDYLVLEKDFQIYWEIKTNCDGNSQPIITISYPLFPKFILLLLSLLYGIQEFRSIKL